MKTTPKEDEEAALPFKVRRSKKKLLNLNGRFVRKQHSFMSANGTESVEWLKFFLLLMDKKAGR